MTLPLLPGNSIGAVGGGKTRFNKSHHFDVCNDVAMDVGEYKCGIGGTILPDQKFKQHSVYPPGEGRPAPAWIAFDRQVLSFDAYFQEDVIPTISSEKFRIRTVKIYFYLEDDSIQVIEPIMDNSGLPQGTLIRRHRIPLPLPNDDKFYTCEQFNVGAQVELYGKTFHLVSADKFTVNFLTKMGVKVGSPLITPADPHTNVRRKIVEEMKPLRPTERLDSLRQFLQFDRHVLRFNCYFEDEEVPEYREMVLHYYLADDTLEIREVIRPNAGRDAVPVFVKRAKLPKSTQAVYPPGVITARTVLNVTRDNHILDSLRTGAVKQEFYTDADLQIGNVINAWGRPIKLVDCDDFTKEFYRRKYDVQSFAPLENIAVPRKQPVPPREIAPYNGFGSEDDSRANCDALLPKPPQKDFVKFMHKDRAGLTSHQLRFVCKIDSVDVVQQIRRFVCTYYLSDDTISMFESSGRNSGIIGGKFMERSRVPLPDQDRFKSTKTQYYCLRDISIGAKLTFNGQKFIVVGADEYALSYMENNPIECPQSNVDNIIAKLKLKLTPEIASSAKLKLEANDDGSGYVSCKVLNEVLAHAELSEHELLCVGRRFGHGAGEPIDVTETTVAIVQDALRKKRFDDFGGLLYNFEYEDMTKTGVLDVTTVRQILKAFKVPISDNHLTALVNICAADSNVDYKKFLSLVDYKSNPARSPTSEDYVPKSAVITDLPVCSSINYKELLSVLS